MPIELRGFLQDLGVCDAGQKQIRPVNREDLIAILDANEGSVRGLFFNGLDFSRADIRGLNLSRAYFYGCNFSRVIAFPLIKDAGRDLSPYDSGNTRFLTKWERDDLPPNMKVTPTRLEGAFLSGTQLDHAHFEYANLRRTHINGAKADSASFYHADLRQANLRFASFLNVDLRCTDLRDANLFGFAPETVFLDDIDWGENHIVSHERQKQWADAVTVYRALRRAHKLAGFDSEEGEFHYRLQKSKTREMFDRAVTAPDDQCGRGIVRRWLSVVRHNRGRTLTSVLLRRAVDTLAGFGERQLRIPIIFLLTLLAFSFAYIEYSPLEITANGFKEFFQRFGRAIYFSAASHTALGYGSWVSNDVCPLKYLGVVQSILGTLLIALFLVVFTRRWMR